MLLYKSSMTRPRLPARRKYRDVEQRHGDAWRSVSAEPSFAASQRSPHTGSVTGHETASAWSGAPEGGSARGTPLASPGRRSTGSSVRRMCAERSVAMSSAPSTAESTAFQPAALRGKHVNSIHAQGVLSDWSTEFPAAVVAEAMHVIYDEVTDQFDCTEAARLKASKTSTDQHMEKRQKALGLFDSIAERRGVLGMCGDVGKGPEAGLIPATTQEKLRLTKPGTASCGPICSFLNQRTEREQNLIQRAMEETGVCVQPQAPDRKNTLKLEFLGADEEEPNVFYFEQTNANNPHQTGHLKWRLSCFVDRVWKSAAPRPYGPSREWGGRGAALNRRTATAATSTNLATHNFHRREAIGRRFHDSSCMWSMRSSGERTLLRPSLLLRLRRWSTCQRTRRCPPLSRRAMCPFKCTGCRELFQVSVPPRPIAFTRASKLAVHRQGDRVVPIGWAQQPKDQSPFFPRPPHPRTPRTCTGRVSPSKTGMTKGGSPTLRAQSVRRQFTTR